MKKLFTILAVVILTVSVFAQAPQKMSYQAVIRNSSNVLITSTSIGMRVSILKDSITGAVIYKEIYNPNPQTNANGLVTLEIGAGIPLTGTFSAIDWSNGTYFIKTESDPTGGTTYTITGTSQLLSVPYALYAANGVTPSSIIPVGTILPFAGSVVPTGWLLCNGATINRSTYSALFSVVNISWGAGDYSTTFNVPDLRGVFMRGVDGAAGNDPDAATRTALHAGGNTGNNVGSYQGDELLSHTHDESWAVYPVGGSSPSFTVVGSQTTGAGSASPAIRSTDATGGSETRAKNVYVNYIIKY